MDLLQQAARLIHTHLKTHHPGPETQMCVDLPWRAVQPRVDAAVQAVKAGHPWPALGDPVSGRAGLPVPPDLQGRLHLAEEWWYPPPDWLGRVDESMPIRPQGVLWVGLAEAGEQLGFMTPLCGVEDWVDPRQMWRQRIQPFHAARGTSERRMRQIQRTHAAAFQLRGDQPHERIWAAYVTAQTPSVEVLTNLVLAAQAVGFPVSEQSRGRAQTWIRGRMRRGLRIGSLDDAACSQWVDDLEGPIHEALLRRFYWPGRPETLDSYIQRTTQGYVRNAWRDRQKEAQVKRGLRARSAGEPVETPLQADEDGVYHPDRVAEAFNVDVSTVYRWLQQHGGTATRYGGKGLSGAQLTEFEQRQRQRQQRRAVMDYLVDEQNKTRAAAKKWMQRRLAHGDRFEDMVGELLGA